MSHAPIMVTANKKDILADIRSFCNDCVGKGRVPECDNKKCKLWRHRIARSKEADQFHLYRMGLYEDFRRAVQKAAGTFNGTPFYPSELQAACGVRPLKPCWWGTLYQGKEWQMNYVPTGDFRKSENPKSKGSFEHQWAARNRLTNATSCY